MTRSHQEVEALWRRWRRLFGWSFIALTAVILGAAVLLRGHGGEEPVWGPSVWAKIAAIHAIAIGYGAIQWRAAKRAFLSGKSEDEALRARI